MELPDKGLAMVTNEVAIWSHIAIPDLHFIAIYSGAEEKNDTDLFKNKDCIL